MVWCGCVVMWCGVVVVLCGVLECNVAPLRGVLVWWCCWSHYNSVNDEEGDMLECDVAPLRGVLVVGVVCFCGCVARCACVVL